MQAEKMTKVKNVRDVCKAYHNAYHNAGCFSSGQGYNADMTQFTEAASCHVMTCGA